MTAKRPSRFGLLMRYALPHRRGWINILILTLLAGAAGILQPVPLAVLIDQVLYEKPLPGFLAPIPGAGSRRVLLAYVVVAGFVVFLGASLLNAALTIQWIKVGQRMVYDLAADLFANLQRRSLVFHSRHTVGDSVARITGDCWSINGLGNALLLVPIHSFVMLVAMVAIMARIDGRMTLITLAVTPFMALASWFFGKPIRRSSAAKREVESAIQSHVQQTLTGIPVVQAFGQEDRESLRFRQRTTDAMRLLRRTTVLSGLAELTPGLLAVLGTALVLWIGGHRAIRGEISPGQIIMFIGYLTMMNTHLGTMLNTYTTLQGTFASTDRVLEMLESPLIAAPGSAFALPAVANSPNARPIGAARGHVRLENVTFGYDPDRPVLRDLSFEARESETVAIVGPTGAGKSTLVSLIPRLFDPQQGRVLLDDIDIRELAVASLRSQISLVLQEPFLFPITIAQNIALGRPDATREQIIQAAEAASAHEFIIQLPQGYDTEIGERGVTLSGGQRQRLSIARAVLKDAPVLVLDEPTSALDPRTEGLLMDALKRLMKGRTTIVIAHRLSTIRDADRIVVLDQGRVIESGTHDQLMAQQGLYSRFQKINLPPITAATSDI